MNSEKRREPLAARMRPRSLGEFIGQEHIIGGGRLLRRAIEADMITAVIFSGPPGTGKTTLARIIAHTTQKEFTSLNAVLGGVKEVRTAIAEAERNQREYQRGTILFVDEVHRWNKAQQDALLPWVENGVVSFIGATTHNPFFEINNALLSRSRIFQLKSLTDAELHQIIEQTLLDSERGYGQYNIRLQPEAAAHIVRVCNGDARSLLNALQLAVENGTDEFPPQTAEQQIVIDLPTAAESIQRKAVLYDRDGDYHYDHISAFIKSVRGSDPDAALYWLAKMIYGGEDPRFIFRRLLISASEDIGLADPQALVVTQAAAAAFETVGLPEGQFHLSQATLYCALADKSNSTLGYFDALKTVEEEASSDPPRHLQDGSRDRKEFGHGEGYKYPHAYADHWVAQQYLPDSLKGRLFYTPHMAGFEGRQRERLLRYRALQLQHGSTDELGAAGVGAAVPGSATEQRQGRASASTTTAHWLTRISEERIVATEQLCDTLFRSAPFSRGASVWVVGDGVQPYLWGVLQRTTAKQVTVSCVDEQERQEIAYHLDQLPQHARPVIADTARAPSDSIAASGDSAPASSAPANGAPASSASSGGDQATRNGTQQLIVSVNYARAFLRDAKTPYHEQWQKWLMQVWNYTAEDGGHAAFVERLPGENLMLARVLRERGADEGVIRMIEQVERGLRDHQSAYCFDTAALVKLLDNTQWQGDTTPMECEYSTQHAISKEGIARWLRAPSSPPPRPTFATVIAELYTATAIDQLHQALIACLMPAGGGIIEWPMHYTLIVARRYDSGGGGA